MLRALILADDLSGAADCAVAFASAGLSTIVCLTDAIATVDAEVLSIDADTRHLAAAAAAAAVRWLVLSLAPAKNVILFKKIDSTLRGHVGVELAAMLDAYRSLHPGSPRPIAVCAPAFPAMGRTTVNGMQWLHGKPLHETEMGRLHGMTQAVEIPAMLLASGLQTSAVPLHVVRSEPDLKQAMRVQETDVLVCDAQNDEDLQAIARAAIDPGRKILLVGSAGLAHHLPIAGSVPGTNLPPVSGPLLFVIGSLSPRSMEQMQELTASSPVLRLSVPPDILLSGTGSMAWRSYERQLQRAIERQTDVLLGPGSEFQIDMADRPLLAASLARMTASVRDRVGGLVAAGGETARSVLQSWGVTALRLLGEVEKGLPVSVTEGWSRQLPVITKAGDFGQPETLVHCRQYLRKEEA